MDNQQFLLAVSRVSDAACRRIFYGEPIPDRARADGVEIAFDIVWALLADQEPGPPQEGRPRSVSRGDHRRPC